MKITKNIAIILFLLATATLVYLIFLGTVLIRFWNAIHPMYGTLMSLGIICLTTAIGLGLVALRTLGPKLWRRYMKLLEKRIDMPTGNHNNNNCHGRP